MASSLSLTYPALPTTRSIRLLMIAPTRLEYERGPLSYHLVVVSIDAYSNRYHALSYTWGSPAQQELIRINGEYVLVRKNLSDFLEQLQQSQWAGYLWIDALCIDQKNTSERNQQVQMMHEIYASACAVFAWLGQSSPLIDRLFEGNNSQKAPSIDVWVSGARTGYSMWQHPDIVAGVLQVLRKPYWKRVWIAQELALAKKVKLMCGNNAIDSQQFTSLIGDKDSEFPVLIFSLQKMHPKRVLTDWEREDVVQLSMIGNLLCKDPSLRSQRGLDPLAGAKLSFLISTFGHMECQDNHDHIYGLLGLSHHSRETPAAGSLRIEYKCSMTKLFTDTWKFCALNERMVGFSEAVDLTSLLLMATRPLDPALSDTIKMQHYARKLIAELQESKSVLKDTFSYYKLGCPDPDPKIERWALIPSLAMYTGSESYDHEAFLFDRHALSGGESIFMLNINFASALRLFRPPPLSSLAVAVSSHPNLPLRVVFGICLYKPGLPKKNPHIIENDRTEETDPGKMLLIAWRRITEDHLKEATLELSADGKILSIAVTLSTCIKLTRDLREAAEKWGIIAGV